MKNTVIFVANRGYALTSSRKSVIKRFIESGWNVVVATANDVESQVLVEAGVALETVHFSRGGAAVTQDIFAYKRLCKVYRKWKPSLIHHFHAKPIILGTIAARRSLGSSVTIVNTITGLGHAFIVGGWVAKLAGVGYRQALPSSDMTIFQNHDDYELFLAKRWVDRLSSKLIVGSGVDILKFAFFDRCHRDCSSPVVVMIGRLLRQKGIVDFAKVAERVVQRFPNVRFLLAGEEDPFHPDSISAKTVEKYPGVEYLGRLENVLPLLTLADLMLFPSYREGVPRAVLEAAATGLPTVGFDVPGVKEAVINNKTGLLVNFGDIDNLHDTVVQLLEDRGKRLKMGRAASAFIKQNFDRRNVEESYIKTYQDLGIDVT